MSPDTVSFLTALGGAVVGTFGSPWLGSRDQRRRQRGIADILHAEVRRITVSLRPTDPPAAQLLGRREPHASESVHRWVEGVIAQGVEVDPEVVTQFLALDRELELLRHAAKVADRHRTQLSLARLVQANASRKDTEGKEQDAANLREVETQAIEAAQALDSARGAVFRRLDGIESLTSPHRTRKLQLRSR
jgi:hypothetical protein